MFSKLFRKEKKKPNKDILAIKRRQRRVELQLQQVEQTIAMQKVRRGSNR